MSLITNVRKTRRGVKNIFVDIKERVERSFGKHIEQLVEIHYSGQPVSFYYGPNARIEETTIDVVKRELNPKKTQSVQGDVVDVGGLGVSLNERLTDKVEVAIKCQECNREFNKFFSSHADLDEINNTEFLQRINDKEILLHHDGGHKLIVVKENFQTVSVPEESKIKKDDFKPTQLKYYKLFSKNPAEVDFLVMYNQNMLTEAPQYKYTETRGGEKEINRMILGITIFAWMATIVAIFMFLANATSVTTFTPNAPPSNVVWQWAIFGTVIGAIVLLILDRIYIKSKTFVKYVTLSPAPFNISNRGILPVFMANSAVQNPFDYVAATLHISPEQAKDVMFSLQRHSWNQLAQTKSALMYEKMNGLLQSLIAESHDLRNYDMMIKQEKVQIYGLPTLLMAAIVPVVITILVFVLVL